MRLKTFATLCFALALGGCDLQACVLGLAHGDCDAPPADMATVFPADDSICRSYGLSPGTPGYARCREVKAHMRHLTEDEFERGFPRNPLTPDLR